MPLKWSRVWISDETYESAGVFDVNNNGVPDIVSGGFWYQGPDFRQKHIIGVVQQQGEYFDDFSTIAMDVNGNGYTDFVTGGWWGGNIRWRENPKGDSGKQWEEHVIAETGQVETTRAWDIDGDGLLEVVPNTPAAQDVRIFKLKTDSKGNGIGEFIQHTIFTFPEKQTQGHGLGCGDIAGNGRMDIILNAGWLECPKDPFKDEWVWHPDFGEFGWWSSSVPMLVVGLNGDGINEIIVGNGHGYGLLWLEQKREGDKRTWTKHEIDPLNAQYHDMMWVDIDGDGQCELVTGKRHRAHCGNDPGEWDDLGIYYFKWTGAGFAKQVIDYGPIGESQGCGIHFAVADLRGIGRLDIVAPGKDGLYVYFNEGL